jgi:hypothetical protein
VLLIFNLVVENCIVCNQDYKYFFQTAVFYKIAEAMVLSFHVRILPVYLSISVQLDSPYVAIHLVLLAYLTLARSIFYKMAVVSHSSYFSKYSTVAPLVVFYIMAKVGLSVVHSQEMEAERGIILVHQIS